MPGLLRPHWSLSSINTGSPPTEERQKAREKKKLLNLRAIQLFLSTFQPFRHFSQLATIQAFFPILAHLDFVQEQALLFSFCSPFNLLPAHIFLLCWNISENVQTKIDEELHFQGVCED